MAVEWDQIYIVYLFTRFINHVSVEWFYSYEINWLNRTRCKFGPNQISSFLALNTQNSRPANLLNIIAGQKKKLHKVLLRM